MSPEIYRLLHIVGVVLLLLGLGGILAAGRDKAPALFLALHGSGLLVMLVAGIGFAHKSGLVWGNWLFAKIGCWVVIGAMPVLVRRGVLPRTVALLLVVGIAAAAAWLAQTKPF